MSYNDFFVYVWISLRLHLHEINVSKWTMLWLLIQTFSVTNVTPNIWSTVTGLNTIGCDPSTSTFRSITSNSNVQYFSKAGMKEKFAIFTNYQTLLLLSKCCFTSLVHMSCPSLLSLVTISKTSLFCGTFSTTYGRILGHSSSPVTLWISKESWLKHSVHVFNNSITFIKLISTLSLDRLGLLNQAVLQKFYNCV